MKRIKFVLKIGTLLSCVFLLSNCTINPDHTSDSILLVARVVGHTDGGDAADFLESDVFEDVDLTYVADIITATLEAKLKEPVSIGLGPSYQNRINIHSYDVSYTYVDSNIDPIPSPNAPAIFTGRLSEQIDIDGSVEIAFVIVRAQAKTELPLVNVAGLDTMQVVARIRFYGEDIAGNPIEAIAYLTIYFANYADA
jgi:hypothetical protein